jgi:hypothetical protein
MEQGDTHHFEFYSILVNLPGLEIVGGQGARNGEEEKRHARTDSKATFRAQDSGSHIVPDSRMNQE